MTMFKKILVPLDGSMAAEKALTYAEEMTRIHGAQLHLVSVCALAGLDFPVEAGYYISPQMIESQLKSQLKYLSTVQSDLRLRGTEALIHGLEGNAVQKVLEFAEAEKFDLILLTSHGRTSFKRLFLGSVAENIARLAPCPVLLVGHESFRTPNPSSDESQALAAQLA